MASSSTEPSWLRAVREHSRQQFDLLSFPSFKHGMTSRLQCPVTLSLEGSPSVAMIPDYQALHQTESFDKFDFYNRASFSQAQTIHLQQNEKKTEPLILTPPAGHSVSAVYIRAEKGSEATILFDSSSVSSPSYSCLIDLELDEGSSVTFVDLQGASAATSVFLTKRAFLSTSARLRWFDLHVGGLFTHAKTFTYLTKPEAAVEHAALFFGSQQQQFHLQSSLIHQAPSTQSRFLARGALTDQSKAISYGTVSMDNSSSGSSGHQKQDILLLSDQTFADAIPQLVIKNHDVSCTHGTTISSLDPEKLFYLMSRGFSDSDARQMLLSGFFSSFTQSLPSSLSDYLLKKLTPRIPFL